MMEIIKVPFGYLLDFLVSFSGSYGVALILFSLVLKIILLPTSAKSRKSSMKMARIAPQIKALEIECGEDKEKYQKEVSKLYKQEGLGCTGGCLWSFIPLLVLIPLYAVIREPITYIMHIPAEYAAKIVEVIGENVSLSSNSYYQQMEAAAYVMEYKDAIAAALPADVAAEIVAKLKEINFSFLGLNLNLLPSWKVWQFFGAGATWQNWGLFLIPILSAGSQLLSMFTGQLSNNKVVTNEKGEQDKDAQNTANSTNRTMMLVMPLMSLYFCFVMPAAISVYWFAQSVFGMLQDIILGRVFRKQYEEEDMKRREAAAELAAKEAERERIRAEKRAERIAKMGEDNLIDPNTSKKKLKQQEEAAKKAAADAYAASKMPAAQEEPEEEFDKHFSGDPERPYCRGRAYKPNRYGRKDDQE